MRKKTALVLSAGGTFGAYQAGAWRELSARFQPDVIIGTSVGALNGWAIAGGCSAETLVELWNDESAGGFLRFRVPVYPWRGLFDSSIFGKHVQKLFSAFAPQIPIGVTLTDVLQLRPRLVRSDEITWQHLAAACAIPVGLPPMRIGGRWYADGGLLNALPVWAAAEMGATRVIAINALPRLPSRLLRAAAGALRSITPKGPPSPASLEIVAIAPETPLGSLSQSVRWQRETIQRWIGQGADDARRVMAAERVGSLEVGCQRRESEVP